MGSFNRTIEELKYNNIIPGQVDIFPFNRTIEELKLCNICS